MQAFAFVVLGLVAAASAAAVGVLAGPEEDLQIRQIRAQIFERRVAAQPLGPDKTFELLNKLFELYERRKDQESMRMKYQVRDMIMLREKWRSKCNLESFNELKSMIHMNLDYRTNLLPYLQDCKQRRFQFCKSIISEEVQHAVDELDEEDKKDLELLIREVDKAKDAVLEAEEPSKSTRSPTIDGIVNFMRIKLNLLGNPKAKPNRKQIGYAPELCTRIHQQLKPPMEMFMAIQNEKNLIDQLDSKTNEWLNKQKFCRDIMLKKNDVTEEVFDIMVAHNGNTGPLCGLFSCSFWSKSKSKKAQA